MTPQGFPSFAQGLDAIQGSPVGMYLLPMIALVGGAFLWVAGGRAVKPLFVIVSMCLGMVIGGARLTPFLAPHIQSFPPVYAGGAIGGIAGILIAVAFFRAAMGIATAITLASIAMLAAASIVGVRVEHVRPMIDGSTPPPPAIQVRRADAQSNAPSDDQAVVVYDGAKDGKTKSDTRRGGYTGPGKSQAAAPAAKRDARAATPKSKPAADDVEVPSQQDLAGLPVDSDLLKGLDLKGLDLEKLRSLQSSGGTDMSALAGLDPESLKAAGVDGLVGGGFGNLTGLGLNGGSDTADRPALAAVVKERATAAWSSLPAKARHSLIVAGLAGASLGLVVGVIMPRKSAALMTATLGSAMMLGSSVSLVRTMDAAAMPQKLLAMLEQRGPAAWLVAWAALAVLGMIIQASRRKKKGEEEAA